MLATAVDQSGTSMTAASRPTAAEEMPRPNSAVTIGRPAATSVPKVRTQHERGDHQADGLGGQLALLRGGDDLAAHLDAQPVLARGLARARSGSRRW